uniref:Uncharacterized protein n=1 Tax=Lepisosteus oculatus TaxID=7918 RepID=W5MP05_LEPOC
DTQKSTSREPSPRGGAKLRKEELQRELQLSTERQRDREGQRRKEREVERVGEGQREREAGRPGDRKGETSHRTRDRGGMADDEREREKRRRQREKERAADLQARGKESWREGRRQAERERADAMSWNGRGATTMDRDGLRDRETEGQREARQAGTYPRAEKRRTDKGREGERRLERQGRMEEEGRDSGREGERRRERNSEAGRQRVEETARQKGTEGIRERLRQGEGGRPPREPQRARDRDRGSELYARDREGVKDQPRDREREDEKQGERRRERKDRLAPGESWRSEGDVVREPEGEGDGESVGEGWEEEGRGGESDRGSWGEREQESEGERVRTPRDQLSGEDGFVTVSSGGEGEEFEDCKEFLEVARAQGGDGAASHVMRQPTEYWDCLSEREQTEEREEERPREVETAHKGGTENERRRRHTERGPEEGGEGEGREEGWPRGETDTVQQGWQEREGGEGEKENVDQVGDTRRPRVRVFCVIGQNLPQGTGLEREHRPPTDAEDISQLSRNSKEDAHVRSLEPSRETESSTESSEPTAETEINYENSAASNADGERNDGEIQEIGQRDTQHEQELGTDGEMSGNAERRTEREPQTGAPLRVEIENDRDMVIRAHSESESETNLCLSKTPLVKANSCPNSLESPSNEQHPWAAERAEGENGSFRDQGQQARVRRRGFRKTMERDRERWSIMESSEGRDEEEGENRRRDRRTRVFNTSDDDDELSISLSEVDLRQMALKHVAGHLRKRNSKFFQSYSQLYQQYREVVLDREIQRQSRSDTLSEEHTPQEVQRIQSRPLPLPPPTHFLALPLAPSPSASAARSPSPSPRLSLSFASSPSLWQELPGVRDSAALSGFGQDRRRLQEVQFEVVSSEASYARSLDIAVDHFQHSSQLGALLSAQDRNWLFSRLSEVRAVSHRFLAELEERVEQDILNFTVCDIIERHCPWFRQVYVPYLTNQSYQEKTFQRLMESCPGFQRVVEKLERNPMCQRLPLRSFLILPFQRITRLKLLVQNILKRTPHNSAEEFQASRALKSLEKLIQESNNSIRQMKSIENLVSLSARVEFECREFPLISDVPLNIITDTYRKQPVSLCCSVQSVSQAIWHHTHTDCLLPLSLSSFLRGGRLLVFEYAPVSQVRVENCRVKLHSLQKNLFRLHLAQTSEGHSKALLLRTDTQSNKLRWISALSQPHPEIDFTTAQDSPQVQCLRSYVSQQPDELTLEKADVLLVHQQSSDGWVEGTRLSDCERGWFPLSHVELISSRHARELNLLDTQKVTTATCKGTRP